MSDAIERQKPAAAACRQGAGGKHGKVNGNCRVTAAHLPCLLGVKSVQYPFNTRSTSSAEKRSTRSPWTATCVGPIILPSAGAVTLSCPRGPCCGRSARRCAAGRPTDPSRQPPNSNIYTALIRTAPNRTVLYFTAPHHTTLIRTAPHRTVPYYTSPHTTPHCTAPHHTTPHRTAPHHTALHRTAPHHTVQHRTTPYFTAPCFTAPHRTAPHRTAPHRTAPHRTAPHRTPYHAGARMIVSAARTPQYACYDDGGGTFIWAYISDARHFSMMAIEEQPRRSSHDGLGICISVDQSH